MYLLLLLMLVSSTVVGSPVEAVKECPPWFKLVDTSNSTGYCACDVELPVTVYCDQINQMSFLAQGSCAFHDFGDNITRVYWCHFLFPTTMERLSLPPTVSELNSVVCGNLGREVKGPLCGRCTNNTGPSVYSVGSRCVPCSPVNILYYILLQYFPSTLICVLVIIFRPRITSAPMANYILFCNSTVLYFRFILWAYIKLDGIIGKTTLTLSAIWSFDALFFVSPPLCLSEHLEEFYIHFLEFLATIYPFIVLTMTYGVIKLHMKNFKPLVALWRLCRRCYVGFYRAWDPRSSMIQAFASLFFLSYAKLSYLIWESIMYSTDINNKGHMLLYIDPSVPYLSQKHVLLMAFSVAVAVFVFLPPLLILVVYPTSLYRKISHWISPKWRLRIKTYVETFNGCFKDGTNGTRDYRSLSGWILLLSGFFPQLFIAIVSFFVPGSQSDIYVAYPVAILFSIIAILCTFLQPYKERVCNALTSGLLVISSLIFATATGFYNTNSRNELVKLMMLTLLMTPHCVLWGYVVWRATYFCRRSRKSADGGREGLLDLLAESVNYDATVDRSCCRTY